MDKPTYFEINLNKGEDEKINTDYITDNWSPLTSMERSSSVIASRTLLQKGHASAQKKKLEHPIMEECKMQFVDHGSC